MSLYRDMLFAADIVRETLVRTFGLWVHTRLQQQNNHRERLGSPPKFTAPLHNQLCCKLVVLECGRYVRARPMPAGRPHSCVCFGCSRRRVVSVKKLYHRLGLAMAILLSIQGIDPFALLGVWNTEVVTFLSANVTVLIFACVSGAAYYMANAVAGLTIRSKPVNLKRIFSFLVLASLVATNAAYLWMFQQDEERLRGYVYLWWGAAFCIVVVFTFVVIAQLRQGIHTMLDQADPESTEAAVMAHSLRKLLFFQVLGGLLGLVGVLTLLVRGINKLSQGQNQPVSHSHRREFSIVDHFFLLVQWLCILLFLWWAYIPMHVCDTDLRLERSGSGATGSSADIRTRLSASQYGNNYGSTRAVPARATQNGSLSSAGSRSLAHLQRQSRDRRRKSDRKPTWAALQASASQDTVASTAGSGGSAKHVASPKALVNVVHQPTSGGQSSDTAEYVVDVRPHRGSHAPSSTGTDGNPRGHGLPWTASVHSVGDEPVMAPPDEV